MAFFRCSVVREAAARVLSAFPKAAPTFTLTKHPPQLVAPDRPTPNQSLYLSNIDDQLGLRYQTSPLLLFYGCNSTKKKKDNEKDPVKIIKQALAKVLVHYYPFAGRLKDADDGKLTVDCTGEGILFVEAEADISLEDFGDLYPPIPRGDDFIANVPGSETITDSPLLLIQITRLRCGGFVLGLRANHCMSDGVGVAQFMKALGETARGAPIPTVPPVWNREILRPREKPIVKYPHHEYEYVEDKYGELSKETSLKSFFFGSKEMEALKRQLEGGSNCTAFEVLSACLWQSRAQALNIPPQQDLRLIFALNARSRFQPPLPTGYYGNLISFACAGTKCRDLTGRPLSFAVNLMKEAKSRVDEEYMRSLIDFMEMKGHPHVQSGGSYFISDTTKIDFGGADFGWGKAIYANNILPSMPNFTFFSRHSWKDFEGIAVPVRLPPIAMKKFEENINKCMN